MLYTSYFAGLRKLPPTITPLAICASPPRWFTGENYTKLAPDKEFLFAYKEGKRGGMLDYWDFYWKDTLGKLNPVEIYQDLLALGKPDLAICCYEAPEDFCHRHIVAHWLSSSVGVVVREYGNHPIIFGG